MRLRFILLFLIVNEVLNDSAKLFPNFSILILQSFDMQMKFMYIFLNLFIFTCGWGCLLARGDELFGEWIWDCFLFEWLLCSLEWCGRIVIWFWWFYLVELSLIMTKSLLRFASIYLYKKIILLSNKTSWIQIYII